MRVIRYKVVVTDYTFDNLDPEAEILNPLGAEIVALQSKSLEELIEVAKDADILLNCYFRPLGDRLFKEAKNLLGIVRYGIGVDTIDIDAATRNGVIVANIPDYCIEEVSDQAIAFILALNRKILSVDGSVRREGWNESFKLKSVFRLQGQTVGIIGFGRIGRLVAKKARCLGLNVVFFDPYIEADDASKYDVKKVDLKTLLSLSDYVTLHAPATEETYHMIDYTRLKMMKPTAFLINCSRGHLVDTEGLINALQEDLIAGAALDVIEDPSSINKTPLIEMDNVILTSHTAYYSEESVTLVQRLAAEEVARVLRGEWPKSFINPEVKKNARLLKRRFTKGDV